MAKKRVNFRDLRKVKGIGWRNFLWEVPEKLIGSVVVGLTGATRVLQIGGLIAGLATAAGVVTTLGVAVVGIAGGIFTALAISVGIYDVVKQSKAREKKIAKIVGKNGTLEALNKQLALLVKNLSLKQGNIRPQDRESLQKLLFSLHIIEGDTIIDKLYDLCDLANDQNLADEMSKILGDSTDPEVMKEGLRLLNLEYEKSLDGIKLKVRNLLESMANINYPAIDAETRKNMRNLIQTLSQLPGDNFYAQLGCLYGLNEADSKDFSKVLQKFPLELEYPIENLIPLNQAIQSEKALMLAEKNGMNNTSPTRFEKVGTFLKTSFVALVGSLSGFGIVVGIAAFAGVTVATGGIGLIVLVAACATAIIGAVLFVAASNNAQERKRRFEEENNAVADLVKNTTESVEDLNKTMNPAADLTRAIEENERLDRENKLLKQKVKALRKQLNEPENAPTHSQRAPQGGLFPSPNPKRKSPETPDPAPQDAPPSPSGSQKDQ